MQLWMDARRGDKISRPGRLKPKGRFGFRAEPAPSEAGAAYLLAGGVWKPRCIYWQSKPGARMRSALAAPSGFSAHGPVADQRAVIDRKGPYLPGTGPFFGEQGPPLPASA
ncbi:hypothetical protein ACHHV8_02365 [Paenibacillus sp. TAB 01]|uniref:hypothetical protein n=1 Tax=Paenibacillus sp. TAB 01 TaxID=3368988 RepID=UPI003751A008